MVILFLVAAVICAVIGALTVAKWLFIGAIVLAVVAVAVAVIDRGRRPLP